jgi:hypothetical protein
MFLKPGRKHRQYSYTPVYYDPDKEARETGRRPIKFHRGSGKAKTGKSFIGIAIALGIIVYVLYLLSQIGQ